MADKRTLALGLLWLGVTAGVSAFGCYGRICEGDYKFFGAVPGEGQMIDENTWESVPLEGEWQHFPGARQYIFDIPQLGGRRPLIIYPMVSADPAPARTGASFTPAGGNIAELYNPNPDHLEVRNGTCAEYYLRVVVVAEPLPPQPPAPQPDASAPIVDAGTDGP